MTTVNTACHSDHKFAAGLETRRSLCKSCKRAALDLLVEFGQLAADRRIALAEFVAKVLQRVRDP